MAGKQLARPYIGIRYATINRQLRRAEQACRSTRARCVGRHDRRRQRPRRRRRHARREGRASRTATSSRRSSDQAIDGEHPLDAMLSQYSPGDVVPVTVLRDGKTITLQVTLGTRPADL